jgi:hypothetical protein
MSEFGPLMTDRKLQQRAGAAKANQRQHEGFCHHKMSKALSVLRHVNKHSLAVRSLISMTNTRQYRMKTSTRVEQPGLAWRNIWAKGAAIRSSIGVQKRSDKF